MSASCLGHSTLGKNTLVPNEYEGKWAPEPAWTFWQGGKSLMLLGI